jgi:hypothetical protein
MKVKMKFHQAMDKGIVIQKRKTKQNKRKKIRVKALKAQSRFIDLVNAPIRSGPAQ